MLTNKDKEKPSRLSLGQLSRLQESTERNAGDIFGDIVSPPAVPKPAAPTPAPVPAFRSVTEDPPKEPARAPAALPSAPAAEPPSIVTPAYDAEPVVPGISKSGEGEPDRSIPAAPKPLRRGKPTLKGEPCMAHPGESKRENLVSVRFTPEQMEDLEHWAEAERLPLAVLCRDLILKEMNRNRGLIQKIRDFRQALTKIA
jgi:hypothetical protein